MMLQLQPGSSTTSCLIIFSYQFWGHRGLPLSHLWQKSDRKKPSCPSTTVLHTWTPLEVFVKKIIHCTSQVNTEKLLNQVYTSNIKHQHPRLSYILKNVHHKEAAVDFYLFLTWSTKTCKHSDIYGHWTEAGPPTLRACEQKSHKRQLKCYWDGFQFVAVQAKCYLVKNSRFVNTGKTT